MASNDHPSGKASPVSLSPLPVADRLNHTDGPGDVPWGEIVRQIQANDPAGMEALHRAFSRGMRYLLARQVGPQDFEDRLHDVFITVVRAIQRGDIREPERIMGFARTVAQRSIATHIEGAVNKRQRETELDFSADIDSQQLNPEMLVLVREKAQIMKSALAALSRPDREILERFYLREQTPEQICAEMNLTETQFRLHKSRAKARLGALGQKKANPVRRVVAAVSGR